MTKILENQIELDSHDKIKLAFFDIDGTLLDKEGHYSQSLKKEILRVQGLGVKTAIASGRPSFAAQFLMDELNLKDPGVFCTGAQIYDPQSAQSLKVSAIDSELCGAFLNRLRACDLYYELYTETGFFVENDFASEIRAVHAHHLRCKPVITDLAQVMQSSPVTKFLIGVDQNVDDALLQQLESEFPALIFAYACLPAYPEWRFASIISQESCKTNAFNYLLNHYGVEASNVISFGDAQSDKTFLSLAGIGVAMGNAAEDVMDVADYVTKTAWGDGVAYALSRFV